MTTINTHFNRQSTHRYSCMMCSTILVKIKLIALQFHEKKMFCFVYFFAKCKQTCLKRKHPKCISCLYLKMSIAQCKKEQRKSRIELEFRCSSNFAVLRVPFKNKNYVKIT